MPLEVISKKRKYTVKLNNTSLLIPSEWISFFLTFSPDMGVPDRNTPAELSFARGFVRCLQFEGGSLQVWDGKEWTNTIQEGPPRSPYMEKHNPTRRRKTRRTKFRPLTSKNTVHLRYNLRL